MKKFIIIITCIIVVLFGIYLMRHPILRSVGNYLVYEDSLKHADVIFVLSGQGYERGNEAAKLYKQGLAGRILCTGGNKDLDFLAMKMDLYESAITRSDLLRCGVDSAVIDTLNRGKSTDDESNEILNYCKKNNIHTCIIVSSKFHTRRIKYSFKKKFESIGIAVLIHGAPSARYDENFWWENEYGAIALDNEYIKLLYYHFKGK